MPHRWLGAAALDDARADLRRFAAAPPPRPVPCSDAPQRRTARRALAAAIVVAAAGAILSLASLARVRPDVTDGWGVLTLGVGAALLVLALLQRARLRRSPDLEPALVVDVEGWGGPPRYGGNRWYVTFERADGRRVRFEVGRKRWAEHRVGAIGWTDVLAGELRGFHVAVPAEETVRTP